MTPTERQHSMYATLCTLPVKVQCNIEERCEQLLGSKTCLTLPLPLLPLGAITRQCSLQHKLMHQCHSLHAAPGGDRLPCNISGAAFCQDSGMSLVHYTIRQLQLLVGTLSLKVFPVMSSRAS